MNEHHIRMAWDASKEAPVSHAKEPPRRASDLISEFSPASIERPAFTYDWREQLAAIAPSSHPQMPFTQYRDYEQRLYRAVKILNTLVQVERAESAEDVLGAFDRLRAARHDDNRFRRITNQGRTDFDMKGEDMEALMQLAMVAEKGTALRARLEGEWVRETMLRDNARDGWQLRTDLKRGLANTIPTTDEETLYKTVLAKFAEKDARAAKMEASGLRLVG